MRAFLLVLALAAFSARSQSQEGRGGGTAQAGAVSGFSQPTVLYKAEPEYTQQALDAKLEGVVILDFTVSTDGTPMAISVTSGIGMGLDEKAVECLQKWRFQPAMRNGEPLQVKAAVGIKFSLPKQK